MKLKWKLEDSALEKLSDFVMHAVRYDEAGTGLVFVVIKRSLETDYYILVLSLVDNEIGRNGDMDGGNLVATSRAEVRAQLSLSESSFGSTVRIMLRLPLLVLAGDGKHLMVLLRSFGDGPNFGALLDMTTLEFGPPLWFQDEIACVHQGMCLLRTRDVRNARNYAKRFGHLAGLNLSDEYGSENSETNSAAKAVLRGDPFFPGQSGSRIVECNGDVRAKESWRYCWYQLVDFSGEPLCEPFRIPHSKHSWPMRTGETIPIHYASLNPETNTCDVIVLYYPAGYHLTRRFMTRCDWMYFFHQPWFIGSGCKSFDTCKKLCNLQILAADEKTDEVHYEQWRFEGRGGAYSNVENGLLCYEACHKFSSRLLMSEVSMADLFPRRHSGTFLFLYHAGDLYLYDSVHVLKLNSHMALQWRTVVRAESLPYRDGCASAMHQPNGDALKLVPLRRGRWTKQANDGVTSVDVETIAICQSESRNSSLECHHQLRALVELDVANGLCCNAHEGRIYEPVIESQLEFQARLNDENGSDTPYSKPWSKVTLNRHFLPWNSLCPGFMIESAHLYYEKEQLKIALFGEAASTDLDIRALKNARIIATGTDNAVIVSGPNMVLIVLRVPHVVRSLRLIPTESSDFSAFISATPEFISVFDRDSYCFWLVTFDLRKVCRIPILSPIAIGRNEFRAARFAMNITSCCGAKLEWKSLSFIIIPVKKLWRFS